MPCCEFGSKGVEFTTSPIVLKTTGIELLLGMDWLKQRKAIIQCENNIVVLTTPSGDEIEVEVTKPT